MSEAISYLFDILEIAAGYALATTSSDCHVHCCELAMTNEDCDTVSLVGASCTVYLQEIKKLHLI